MIELTPGQVQWDTQQRRCREAHAHYERLRQMTRSVQEPGVGSVIETAGPARAQWNEYRLRCVAEGIEPMSFQQWNQTILGSRSARWPGAPVGAVTREQAGILETGPKQVTDEMVYRAQTELVRHESPTGASAVRAALKAALQG